MSSAEFAQRLVKFKLLGFTQPVINSKASSYKASMMAMDTCSIISCLLFLLIGAANSQTTQCNAVEYMSVVQNLEALRVQFRELKSAFDELVNTEIANLKEKDTVIDSKISSLETVTDNHNVSLTGFEVRATELETNVGMEIASLKVKDTDIDSKIASLETVTDNHNVSLTGLKDRATTLETNVNSNQQAVTSLNTVTETLTNKIEVLEAGNMNLIKMIFIYVHPNFHHFLHNI